MAGGRAHTSGAVTVTGTSRAAMRPQIVSSPVTQKGPGWASPLNPRRAPQTLGATVAAVGLAISTLVDDFNDNTTDLAIWPNSFGTYSEIGGRARVSCDAGYNAYSSALTYTLVESSIYLRVYPPAAGGATTEAWTQILVKQQTSGIDLGFEVSPLSGNLTMFSRTGFFDAGAVAITYSATDHAWLRIRETGGTVYWDTSPDTLTWTNQRTLASPTWVTDPNLEFQLIAHRSDGTADFAEFDNVNVPPVIVTGDAATAATASVTAAGSNATTGSSSLTATATLSAAGTATAVGTASVSAAAGITAAGARDASGASSVTATAGLSAAGTVGAAGTATMAATATPTAAGRTDATGTAAITGNATLTGAGVRATASTAAAAITGSPTASGTVAAQAAATTSAAVTLSAAGTVTGSNSGDASLTASATATASGLIAATAGGSLTATAQPAATGVRGASSAAATVLTAGLAAAGSVAAQGSASLGPSAALTAAGVCDTAGLGGLTATAVLTASGAIGAAHNDIDVTVGVPYSPWSVGAPQSEPWPTSEPQSSDWEVAAPW